MLEIDNLQFSETLVDEQAGKIRGGKFTSLASEIGAATAKGAADDIGGIWLEELTGTNFYPNVRTQSADID